MSCLLERIEVRGLRPGTGLRHAPMQAEAKSTRAAPGPTNITKAPIWGPLLFRLRYGRYLCNNRANQDQPGVNFLPDVISRGVRSVHYSDNRIDLIAPRFNRLIDIHAFTYPTCLVFIFLSTDRQEYAERYSACK